MQGKPLTIEMIHLDGSAVLAIVGEIDMATAPLLHEAVQEARALGVPIVLDMSNVTFMDSAGLHVLLDEDRALGDEALRVRVRNPSGAVQQILDIAGVTNLLVG